RPAEVEELAPLAPRPWGGVVAVGGEPRQRGVEVGPGLLEAGTVPLGDVQRGWALGLQPAVGRPQLGRVGPPRVDGGHRVEVELCVGPAIALRRWAAGLEVDQLPSRLAAV